MALELLKKLRAGFYSQKYRFDLGLQLLTFVNFALLVITASQTLKAYFGIPKITDLLVIAIPLAFIGVWVVGYFLDTVVKQQQQTEEEYSKRSVLWQKNFEQQKQILDELKRLRKRK